MPHESVRPGMRGPLQKIFPKRETVLILKQMRRPVWRGRGIIVLGTILALFMMGATARHAGAYDLSADTLMVEKGERQEGKISIKGDKYRIQRKGEAEYIILRHDKDVMWVVMPKEKVYAELPLDVTKTPKIQEKSPGEINRKLLGTEVVDGHPAEKFEITVKEGSRTESFCQWTATDINFPIKTAAVGGEWSVEFTNIKKGAPDSVFEVPPDYERARVVQKPPPQSRKGKESPERAGPGV